MLGYVITAGAALAAAFLKGGDLLRERRQRKIFRLRAKLQAICPHVSLLDEEGNTFPTELYYPVKSGHMQCHFCHAKLSPREAKATLTYWHDASRERQEELMHDTKSAAKLREKLAPLGDWTKD